MTHIICRAMTCLFWDEGTCSSEEIEYEPDVGCLTFQDLGDLEIEQEDEDEFDWEDESDEEDYDDDDWEEQDSWEDDGDDL